MNITAFDLAQRFIGVKEVAGTVNNSQIMAILQLDNNWPKNDEVAWCSAFVNYICWLLRLPRSKDLRARSWLNVGRPIAGKDAVVGWDIVVLDRSDGTASPTTIDAPGHVGFYAGLVQYPPAPLTSVYLLGGNQGDAVNISAFSTDKIIGVRRLYDG
jgi:uncharacterized protein (TIGR02594 family)